jgi:hypothetical protein
MKSRKVLCFLFFCLPTIICADELLEPHRVCVADVENDCRNVIEDIFAKSRESIATNEDIITPEWLTRKEIKEIQHLMTDICIVLDFDCNAKAVISERLQSYLQTKIRDEVDKVFESQDITVEGVRQFFYLSRIICELGDGTDCRGMMRAIKNENSDSLQNLKIQRKLQRQVKKEEMRQLRERIILGAHPRK